MASFKTLLTIFPIDEELKISLSTCVVGNYRQFFPFRLHPTFLHHTIEVRASFTSTNLIFLLNYYQNFAGLDSTRVHNSIGIAPPGNSENSVMLGMNLLISQLNSNPINSLSASQLGVSLILCELIKTYIMSFDLYRYLDKKWHE